MQIQRPPPCADALRYLLLQLLRLLLVFHRRCCCRLARASGLFLGLIQVLEESLDGRVQILVALPYLHRRHGWQRRSNLLGFRFVLKEARKIQRQIS